MTGTIKSKIDAKGYGFIIVDGANGTVVGEANRNDKDLFFHSSALVGVTFEELEVGAAVTFDIAEGPKGPNATNVKLVQTTVAA